MSSAEDALTTELDPPARSIAAGSVAVAVISSFLFGYSVCVLNSCGELMAVNLQWCGDDWESNCGTSQLNQGLVNASVYLGAALGAFMSGTAKFTSTSCRVRLIISDLFFAVGAIACGAAVNVAFLIVGRFASGIGLGISAIAAPLHIAEISPRERRGLHAAMNGVFITVGILASITFGLPQGPPPRNAHDAVDPLSLDAWYWRVLLGFPLFPAVAQALLFLYICPLDPPTFLVQAGKTQQARELLYRIYDVQVPASIDKCDGKAALLEMQVSELEEAVSFAQGVPRIRVLAAVFDPYFAPAIGLGAGLAAFQQLCGINGLMSYSNILFEEAGIPPASLTAASTAMATANVMASIASSRMVDHWGRRRLLLSGACAQTIAMVVLLLATNHSAKALWPSSVSGLAAVFCFTIFVMSFSFGLGAVTWLYLSEIYPMEVRGPALSSCGVINWISSFIVVFGTRFLSLRTACSVYGMVCLVGMLGMYLWIVETKGCSMDDSPMTPKSGRSSSTLLTPSSPRVPYTMMEDEEDEDEDENDEKELKVKPEKPAVSKATKKVP